MKRTIAAAALCATFGVTDAAAQAFDVHSAIREAVYALDTLKADKELLRHAEQILRGNAARLFGTKQEQD